MVQPIRPVSRVSQSLFIKEADQSSKSMVKVDTIHGLNAILLTKLRICRVDEEYLGTGDNIPTAGLNQQYRLKCDGFLLKSKMYKNSRIQLRTAMFHGLACGQEISSDSSKKTLDKRQKEMKIFMNTFYEKWEKMPYLKVSYHLEKKKHNWFARYWLLSRFIQAARSVLLKLRLEKHLALLVLFPRASGAYKRESNGKENEKTIQI